MKIPGFRMLTREDLKGAPNWIDNLIYPLNSCMQGVHQALNGNLSFGDNVLGSIKTITFKTRADYTVYGWDAINLTNPLNKKVDAVLIGQIQKVADTYQPIYQPTSLDWIQLNTNITINYITGLDDSSSYVVKLVIL